jgi:hypothetical protein
MGPIEQLHTYTPSTPLGQIDEEIEQIVDAINTLATEAADYLVGPDPTITDFTNAVHDHEDDAGGGLLTTAAIGSGVFDPEFLGTGTPSAATVLRGDGTWGNVTTLARTVLTTKTSPTTINNDASETTVFSYVIPGGTVDSTDVALLFLDNHFFNNTGGNRGFTIRVKIDGTEIASWAYGANLGSVNQYRWYPVWVWMVSKGTTSSQYVLLSLETTTTNTTGSAGVGTGAHSASSKLWVRSADQTFAMSSDRTLSVTIQLTHASTNLEWKTFSGTLELLAGA